MHISKTFRGYSLENAYEELELVSHPKLFAIIKLNATGKEAPTGKSGGVCYTDRLGVNCWIIFFQTEKEKDATFISTLETQPLQKTQPLVADILEPKYYVDMMLEAVIVGV